MVGGGGRNEAWEWGECREEPRTEEWPGGEGVGGRK